MSYHYLLDLALILLSTKFLGIITGRFQMPRVVGSLLAGLVLGPAALNVLAETAFLSQLSEMGVIVILFTAGMWRPCGSWDGWTQRPAAPFWPPP